MRTTPVAARRASSPGEHRHDAAAASPQRRCIVTGEVHDRARLMRFVVGPDGAVVPDIEGRLPGRGLWLTPRRDIVERAVAKRLFARAARQAVAVAPDLADRLESLLARRCCDGLGLARRAGLAVAGFDRVGEALRRGKAGLVLFARDAAAGARGRLGALGRELPSADTLTAAELGAAFDRERIVYAAVGAGKLAERLRLDLSRLAGMRAGARAAAASATGVGPAGPAAEDGGSETHD